MIEVTEKDLGLWVGYEEELPDHHIRFQIAVVELARKHGYDINTEIWEEDKLKFFAGESDEEMQRDLFYVFDYSTQWLEEELSEGYKIELQDTGLVIVKST